VFQRGSFSNEATGRMAAIFFCYCLSMLMFSAIRLLTYYLFALHQMQIFLRISLLYYGATVALDLLYVALLHLGPKGIPLALFTSLCVTCLVIYVQDLANIRRIFDRAVMILIGKDLVAAVVAAGVIWALKIWICAPEKGLLLFLFLCVTCGAGCFAFGAVLTAWKSVSVAQLLEIWQKRQSE